MHGGVLTVFNTTCKKDPTFVLHSAPRIE